MAGGCVGTGPSSASVPAAYGTPREGSRARSSSDGSPSCVTTQPPMTQSQCSTLLAKRQRPLTVSV